MTEIEQIYKAISGIMDTHMTYIREHLKHIDDHLVALNGGQDRQDKCIHNNTRDIKWICLIGGSLIAAIGVPVLLRFI